MFEFFYKRVHFTFAIIFAMFIFGIVGLKEMPKNLFPDSSRPEVVIFASLPGGSSEVIAKTLTKPIEEEMATLSHIYEIKSTSSSNFAIIRVIFDYTKTLKDGAVDVTNALQKVNIPKEAKTSIYLVGDFTAPIDVFSISSKTLNMSEIRRVVESYLKPKLLSSPYIGGVDVFGGYVGSVKISIDVNKLKKYKISFSQIIKALNSFSDKPIGFFNNNGFFTLTFYGQEDLEKLKKLYISKNLMLKDIANVTLSYNENSSLYVGNTKNSIAVVIQKPIGGDLIKASDVAREIVKEFNKEYKNLDIEISDTQRNLVETANINMLEALRDALIFTSIVILFFLTNLRALFAAVLSIPMVFLGTISILYLFGYDLNIIVYTGIILALGMLVDDAIVVLENIERHLEEGDENFIYNGTKEVLGAVFSGTISTIVVIFPLMFVGGYPQRIFEPLILTLIIALILSYFLSITFIPIIAKYLYKNGAKKTKFEIWLDNLYKNTFAKLIGPYLAIFDFATKSVIRRVLLTIGAILILVMSAKNILPTVGRDLMPPMDTGIMKANIEFSSNYTAKESLENLKPFLDWLKTQKWVVKSSLAIGTEPGVLSIGGGGSNSASITIEAVNRFKRDKSIWELEREVRDKLAKLKEVKNLAVFDYGATALSTISAPLDVQFRSDNYENLPILANKAKKILKDVKGLTTLKTTWDKDFYEIRIEVDKNKALNFGVTPIDIISQIALKNQAIGVYTKIPSLKSELITLKFDKKFENISSLKTYPIITKKGVVPLNLLAKIKPVFNYSRIDRYNLEYAIDVLGYREKRPISKITDDANRLLKENKITNYYQVGDVKEFGEAFGRLIKAVGFGVIGLILTLMIVYRSLKLSLIMIVILPISLIGAWFSLLIANKPMCMPAMIGILLLFGVIIKNAVLLIDFYQEFLKKTTPYLAAKESIKVRFRPVMMTAFSTIAGMIPIALEWAVGLERLSPIADIAIGGLLVGTFLTLVYIPIYAYSFYKR
ncbi:efflux RND transporter permease subunit [Caminibacter mediatlanticus TB-2]|uniref:Efflux RND transporter permease subunit n=1 Tax=Caminibacter mediatlanticus TB-2 TaxID=391592 RepID=A0ABX5V738_9BACT|nr:efflux RND transporter permease subunit [Caminibacter mediatlanticus]QCT94090.1 efflux RND transporter permease subunit [Caminibacter mediatlanticus TB-2]